MAARTVIIFRPAACSENHDGVPVFLARNAWDLRTTIEEWPAIRFTATPSRTERDDRRRERTGCRMCGGLPVPLVFTAQARGSGPWSSQWPPCG
jgi:hypothetical protein